MLSSSERSNSSCEILHAAYSLESHMKSIHDNDVVMGVIESQITSLTIV